MQVNSHPSGSEEVPAGSYTAWYSYARLLYGYRHVYFGFNLLACLVVVLLYWVEWGVGLGRVTLLSVVGLILLCSSINLFTDSSFSLKKYGSEAEARKLLNYNFYISSLISGLWGALTLVVIVYNKEIGYALMALLVTLMALNIPRAAVSRAVFYVQTMLIVLPAVFFSVLRGDWSMAGLLVMIALSIGLGVNAIIVLLYAYQEQEQQLLQQIKQGQKNALLTSAEFDTLLKIEWQRASREHQYLSVMKLAVVSDDPKQVAQVTSSIRSVVHRAADSVGYMEGGVFKVLLPNTAPEHALGIAERVQRKITGSTGKPSNEETPDVSIGVAGCRPGWVRPHSGQGSGDDGVVFFPAALVAALNQAQEAAKGQGKNKVHLQAV